MHDIAVLVYRFFLLTIYDCDSDIHRLFFWQIKKPLIERRRRERINDCLNQLKSLVLEASNKDVSTTRYYFLRSINCCRQRHRDLF